MKKGEVPLLPREHFSRETEKVVDSYQMGPFTAPTFATFIVLPALGQQGSHWPLL